MADFSVSTAVNTVQVITAGGVGFVTGTGSITALTASAIFVNGGGSLYVAGAVVAGAGGYGATFYGDGVGAVNIASGGYISGTIGVSMNSAAYTYNVNNAGVISGRSEGLTILSSSVNILNSGDIFGSSYSAVHVTIGSACYLSNSGRVEGTGIGFHQEGAGSSVISNSGRIAGSIYAIVTGNSADRVINTGVLAGTVALNGGTDSFLGQNGVQGTVYGGDGNDSLVGGASDDVLGGDAQNDVLRGNGGEDRLLGGAGMDTLFGGIGDDTAEGGIGADWIYGGAGDDVLNGGFEADRLIGGAGNDVMNGGAGADFFLFELGHGADRITGFADNIDKLDLRAFDLASLAALKAHASDSSLGVRIDLRSFDGGIITLTGMTFAALTAQDVLL